MTLLVPYRDREAHLKVFVPYMQSYLPEAEIVIIEQCDSKPFNRGKLFNIGFLLMNPEHFVCHDIDMLPMTADYFPRPLLQMALSEIQTKDYLGGVTMFNNIEFILSGGYHNDFFHRAEDNEMMFNLKRLERKVQYAAYTFNRLIHPRTGPEFDPVLWNKAQLFRTKNMLQTCEFELLSKEIHDGYTHLRVLL